MDADLLIPLAGIVMIIAIVTSTQIGKTVRYYLDYRMRMAERQPGIGDQNVLRAIQELRAEIAALKQHETEAVLSFDSTLQTLDARVKHLEQFTLGSGVIDQAALAGRGARPVEERVA